MPTRAVRWNTIRRFPNGVLNAPSASWSNRVFRQPSIQTEAFGKQQELTDAEVRSAVERNPELSTEERQKLLDHMNTIILASNRRVDITLSNAGQKSQQSVREYPFNAADSLTLLDTRETGKPAHPARKKRRTTKKD